MSGKKEKFRQIMNDKLRNPIPDKAYAQILIARGISESGIRKYGLRFPHSGCQYSVIIRTWNSPLSRPYT